MALFSLARRIRPHDQFMKQNRRPQTTRLGAALRRARLARGLTLREVGDRVGANFSYIHRLEVGVRRHPSDVMLRALCVELGIRVSDLIS
jgi:transcriptional regulator with XRE-family HTH domain